jgi:predicted ATPase/class 3 adenylate cyclase
MFGGLMPSLRAQPAGTVAFLFTDIEGSTRRWEAYGDLMASAVESHDRLLADAIARCNGYVFKTVGDAFCATFDRVSEAATAAIEAQRALDAADFEAVGSLDVRMAIHVGEAHERDADYFGPAVNRVARLLGTGHGGQILFSGAAERLLRDRLAPGYSTLDLGDHVLQDLPGTERIFQLTGPGLRAAFPALRSASSNRTNIPHPTNALIGREIDVAAVGALLQTARLVSLVGTGGVGKTRIGLELARGSEASQTRDTWFVELAPVSDATLLASVIATAIDVRETPKRSTLDVIARALRDRPTLLVLDNCEHVIEAAAALCEKLIQECPQLQIITTTREPLHIAAESVYTVSPLEQMPAGAAPSADEARRYGAIALFVERARATDSSFTLSDDLVPVVAAITQRLDGIPLAIELAATNTKFLSPSELLAQLDDRFGLLTGGARTALPRQRTLHALIDWSYDLLSEAERALFRRSSVFAGGWSLSAARSVCAGGLIRADEVLILLAALVDKSLVVADRNGVTTRYGMLESVQAFASEKLRQSDEIAVLEAAHTMHVVELARWAFEARGREPLDRWLALLEADLDNVRAALTRAANSGDEKTVAQIASGIGSFWVTTARFAEGRHWVESAMGELDAFDTETQARLVLASARLASGKRSMDLANRAQMLFAELGSEQDMARSYHLQAWLLRAGGNDAEALAAADRGLEIWQRFGDAEATQYATLLDIRATALLHLADYAQARLDYDRVIAILRKFGQHETYAQTRFNQAELECAIGNLEAAAALAQESATGLHAVSSYGFEAFALVNLAGYQIGLRRFDDAAISIEAALEIEQRYGVGIAALAVEYAAAVCIHRTDFERAAKFAGYAEAWYRTSGIERGPTERLGHDFLSAALRERCAEQELLDVFADGARMTEDEAVEQALSAMSAGESAFSD